MAKKKHVTTDYDEIRQWADQHNGEPAITAEEGNRPGKLKFLFPEEHPHERVKSLGWQEFFEDFEEQNLALAFDSPDSRAYEFVDRNEASA